MSARFLLISALALGACAHLPEARAPAEAFDAALGAKWSGNLTYLNYSPPLKDYTIPAELTVTKTGSAYTFAYAYPDEPQENSTSEYVISPDGARIGDEIVTDFDSRNGTTRIETEFPCEENGETLTCRKIYTLSAQDFTIRKMVEPGDGKPAFRRNEYVFKR